MNTNFKNARSLQSGQIQQSIFKLTPSELTFLWEDCRRCFYQKVVNNIHRPWSPMPKIFTRIHTLLETWASGKRTELLAPGMPPGVVEHGEHWVESSPIVIPGRESQCFIRGKFDTIAKLEDNTYAIIDFKTCSRQDKHLELYSRQLHAYALALENPAEGRFSLSPISKLGLLVWEPSEFSDAGGLMALAGSFTWIEIPLDVPAFLEFLSGVLEVLEQPMPPEPSPGCEYCIYQKLLEVS